MANIARKIVRDVLPRQMADEIWSAGYDKALPISSNAFELSAVLPAVFYMFRFGERRGRGKFLGTFASENETNSEHRRTITVDKVAHDLTSRCDLDGFDGEVEKSILGDLLLCFALENRNRALGRDQQIQRVAPAHYMSSWIDLPESVTHLRHVPEMIVAMLANQTGDHIQHNNSDDRVWFAVATGHQQNLLLRTFNQGIELKERGEVSSRTADQFDENEDAVGVDQLLMIRLAQQLGAAPDKIRGENARISNQRPISDQAAEYFSEDIRRFIRKYANIIPRRTFVDMLESCIATSMTAILTSIVEILSKWDEIGNVLEKQRQRPTGIFVDCSNGINSRLNKVAGQSFDDLMRRIERIPMILTMLRLLDYAARDDRRIRKLEMPTRPYATKWLNLLGSILHERHERAGFIHESMDIHGTKLADALEETFPEVTKILRNEENQPNPIRRLATALTTLQGSQARTNLIGMIDSILHIERPNGLAQKRTTSRGVQHAVTRRRRREVRSLVFTDSILDYLVHLHLIRSGDTEGFRSLSLRDFLGALHKRYGFHVDTSPPGMMISNDLLRSNRMILERRLRDLGLLIGVNDAESMKRLRPRFEPDAGH